MKKKRRNFIVMGIGIPVSLITVGVGVLAFTLSFVFALAFAFYLVDAVVQLGIAGALMPFLIASWPFKITFGYTKKGWDIFIYMADSLCGTAETDTAV